MPANREEIFILPGVRTPFGKFGGSLKDLTATDLGVIAARGDLNPDPKKYRGISGVERLRTPVTGILIVGLQLH